MPFNTYEETIDYLYNQLPMFQVLGAGAYKPGLDTSRALDNYFGNKHKEYKCVHIAGTNGKGSTSHTIASVLMAAGYKVGLYTSPHLIDFRERIRVNGKMMPKEAVVDFVNRYHVSGLVDLHPSFFELTTIMAFEYFASQHVDFAVVEVGLGGRLDTTNIINPVLSIITNVSLDHVALLGDTLEKIASEKAAIIKTGVPVVIGEADEVTRKVYEDVASSVGAPLLFAQDCQIDHVEEKGNFAYSYQKGAPVDIACDLQGEWQPKNANTSMAALRIIFNSILAEKLPSGLSVHDAIAVGFADVQQRTGLMGRWMTINDEPLAICDTGHNIGAWQYLAPRLCNISKSKKLHIVIGFANDKDAESIFKLLPKNAVYYYVAPKVKRARSAQDLYDLGLANGLNGVVCKSVEEGYEKALAECSQGDMVYVGGSNFVVAEILTHDD